MNAPVCAVTGATGFVGRTLMRKLLAMGWKVVPLVRNPASMTEFPNARKFILGKPVPSETLAGIDVLIHAAYDFTACGWADVSRINVVGSEYLFDAATRGGVSKQIFISSMAAFEGCKSNYGLGKLAAEEAVRIRKGIVIRPGTIYSAENGGIAAKIAGIARKLPVIPMIGSGHYPLYTCHVDDLCELIVSCINGSPDTTKPIIAADKTPITLLGLAQGARTDGSKPLILPVPWPFLFAALWAAEKIGLRPGFRSDSVSSLVHANPSVEFYLPPGINQKFRPFESMNS